MFKIILMTDRMHPVEKTYPTLEDAMLSFQDLACEIIMGEDDMREIVEFDNQIAVLLFKSGVNKPIAMAGYNFGNGAVTSADFAQDGEIH